MSYRQVLEKQIFELEKKIAETSEDKEKLQLLLQKLKAQEFEESLREDSSPQLLKG
jgi:TolA-binding protein